LSALDSVLGTLDPPPVIQASYRRKRAPTPVQMAAAEIAPPLDPPPPRFVLLSALDVRLRKPMSWALLNVLPDRGLVCVYGPSGSGKSFLTADLAARLSEVGEWFGHRIKKACRVVYVVLEGAGGMSNRIHAWEEFHQRAYPPGVRFVFDAFRISDPASVIALAAEIDACGGADVVIIDTLNRAAPEMDENSSRDMGLALEGCKQLEAMTGGVIVLVHHTGKDSTKGMRGHSSLIAALDGAIEVNRTTDGREWSVAKSKDGADGTVHRFLLEVVNLGSDEDGEPITSCAVRPNHADAPRARPMPGGGNQRIVYQAIEPLLRDSRDFGKAGAPALRPCIGLEDTILNVRDRLTCESDRRGERAREAIKGLVSRGVLGCNGGWLWLI
jgi:hypothetical protein